MSEAGWWTGAPGQCSGSARTKPNQTNKTKSNQWIQTKPKLTKFCKPDQGLVTRVTRVADKLQGPTDELLGRSVLLLNQNKTIQTRPSKHRGTIWKDLNKDKRIRNNFILIWGGSSSVSIFLTLAFAPSAPRPCICRIYRWLYVGCWLSSVFYWLSTDFYWLYMDFYWLSSEFYSTDFYWLLLTLYWLSTDFYWLSTNFYRLSIDVYWLSTDFYWLLLTHYWLLLTLYQPLLTLVTLYWLLTDFYWLFSYFYWLFSDFY